MEAVGIEPTSEIIFNSSHPQACLVFIPQTNKCRLLVPSLFANSDSGVLFSAEPPAYLELGNKVTRNPTIKPLSGQIRNDYCYWQLSDWLIF